MVNRSSFAPTRLNPCFNGRYSQRYDVDMNAMKAAVLILVLMEDTLRVHINDVKSKKVAVLILVLMEDTLREILKFNQL